MRLSICVYSICLLLNACTVKSQDGHHDKEARLLNDSAISISRLGDTEQVLAAIQLLNEATDLQPDYYMAYWNKLVLQRQLGLTDDAFRTLKELERLSPDNPDLKTMSGVFYERCKKDTAQAMIKYNEADLLYKSAFDTIQSNSLSYPSIVTNYALNLKLLKKEAEANHILHSFIQNYDNEDFARFIDTFMIEKTRKELVTTLFSDSQGGVLQ